MGFVARKPECCMQKNKVADQPAHLHSLISAFVFGSEEYDFGSY